ncbi:MAG: oxidoreductase [Myxococcales bacterium]|nr:oxidoreductase [Myxococcales bacterium]
MRGLSFVCLWTIGCGASAGSQATTARVDALETRVATLEARDTPIVVKPAEPTTVDDKIAQLQAKLETLQAELDKGAAAPPPRPTRAQLDENRAYPVPLDDSPAIGPAVAPVTMVAALQFPEPFTHRVFPTLVKLRATYKKELRIVVKSFIVHPRATMSSAAACAAGYQDRLARIEDAIYAAATDQGSMRELPEAELREIARALRLDLKQYDRDLVLCTDAIKRDAAMFQKLGQSGVPGFWINGRPLSGAQPLESFTRVIDEELVKAKDDKARGGSAATYYERVTNKKPNPYQ